MECLNERAEPVVIEAKGWYARILQHEIDHLHGALYIDRMNPHTFSTQDNYTRHWKQYSRLPKIVRRGVGCRELQSFGMAEFY